MLGRKIYGAAVLSVLGFVVLPSQGEVAYGVGGAAPAASGHDPVQHCLDLVQLNLARKIAPALPVTSHPVQIPPKDLPLQCLAGNLEEIKSALKNQIANCGRKSVEEKAQTFQFGCRMVKNEDYCLKANTEMLTIAGLPNMDYTTFVNRAARKFDWYKSNGSQGDEGNHKAGTTRFTGYYSLTAVEASADPSDVYRYPVYGAPEGLTYFENPKPELGQGCVPLDTHLIDCIVILWQIQNFDVSRKKAIQNRLETESRMTSWSAWISALELFSATFWANSV